MAIWHWHRATTNGYRVQLVRELCTSVNYCSNHFTDSQQSLDPAEVVSNASEKMLEHNGHFLRAKMVAEQRAIEIARLQDVVNAHAKENNDLKVKVRTLR